MTPVVCIQLATWLPLDLCVHFLEGNQNILPMATEISFFEGNGRVPHRTSNSGYDTEPTRAFSSPPYAVPHQAMFGIRDQVIPQQRRLSRRCSTASSSPIDGEWALSVAVLQSSVSQRYASFSWGTEEPATDFFSRYVARKTSSDRGNRYITHCRGLSL